MKNIKFFDTQTEYETSEKETSQVTYAQDSHSIFFNEKMISFTATYQLKDIGHETKLYGEAPQNLKRMTIDGVEHKSLPQKTLFTDIAEHSVKFDFVDAGLTSLFSFFNGCSDLIYVDFTEFNVSNLTDTSFMFFQCGNLDCNRTNFNKFDTSKVVDMEQMFYACKNLSLISLNTDNVKNCNKIVGANQNGNIIIGDNFCPNMLDMKDTELDIFYNNNSSSIAIGDNFLKNYTGKVSRNFIHPGYNTKQISIGDNFLVSISNIGCLIGQGINLKTINIGKNFLPNQETTHYLGTCLFFQLTNLETFIFGTDFLKNATSLECLFNLCGKLKSIDLTNLNTTKVTNMDSMFSYCSNLVSIDFSGPNNNINNVTRYYTLFEGLPEKGTFKYNKVSEAKWNEIFAAYPLPSGWAKQAV